MWRTTFVISVIDPQQSILCCEWQTKLLNCPKNTTATMVVTIAGFIHGKYQYILIEQSSNKIAESAKFLSENTPTCDLRVAMSIFFRFGILPDNLVKHALQISVLHTSLVVTLTVAITWPDQ